MKKYLKMKVAICVIAIFCVTACSGYGDRSSLDGASRKISPLAKDDSFKDTLHVIRNERSNTDVVVKGDGTILFNSMRPENETYKLVRDAKTNDPKYIAKMIFGETLVTRKYVSEDLSEEFEAPDASQTTMFYDRDGKEIGLSVKTYTAECAIGDYIIYNDYSVEYENGNLFVYNVKTKESKKATKPNVTYFASHVLFSSDSYGFRNADDVKKEIIVCDDSLNEVGRIDGYSMAGITTHNEKKIGILVKYVILNENKNYSEMQEGVDYVKAYNYLDEDLTLVFDEPVDSRVMIEDGAVKTICRGDIEFDFDFDTMKKIGEDRPRTIDSDDDNQYYAERAKYDAKKEKLQNEHSEYAYIDTKIYNDKVLFFASKEGMYDAEMDVYVDPCDIYSVDGKLLIAVDNLISTYEESGYFLANNDTLYNFDIEVVKKFDEKVFINYVRVGDKIYFSENKKNNSDENIKYNFYDEKMNLLLDNVDAVINYVYDDMLIIVKDGKTKIYDSNLSLVKEIDRRLDIRNWYGDTRLEYRAFTDMDTGKMGIIDGKYNVIVDGMKWIANLEDKCFTFGSGFRFGLMDYDERVICDFSIFNTMNDDSQSSDYDIRYIE